MAWSTEVSGLVAIEVYPAATLIAHGFRSGGYKRREQIAERREILACLGRLIEVGPHASELERSADALDAAVCVLAAQDFLEGRAMAPLNLDLATQEGWIWAAARTSIGQGGAVETCDVPEAGRPWLPGRAPALGLEPD